MTDKEMKEYEVEMTFDGRYKMTISATNKQEAYDIALKQSVEDKDKVYINWDWNDVIIENIEEENEYE